MLLSMAEPPPDPPPSRDAVHHETFSNLKVARSFFESYLPASLAQHCHWPSLQNQTPVYKAVFDSSACCDLLFSVHWESSQQQPLFLHLLFEHQSRPDPRMPFRLLRYMVRIWDAFLKQNHKARHLPAVYPIVLHQSNRPWHNPPNLADLFALPEGLAHPPWLPNLQFHLVDLARIPFDQFRQQVLAHAALAVMKAVDLQHPEEHLATLFDILQIALDPDRNPELLARYLQNFLAFADNLDMPQFHKKLATLADSPMKTKGLSLAEQYIAAGREEGIAAGREEGLSSGRREALLSTTRRQLTRRFGPLPETRRRPSRQRLLRGS